MSFPWLDKHPARRRLTERRTRAAMYRDELEARAGLYYRLGYPPSRALARLRSNLAWDFGGGATARPAGLSEKQLADIVKTTYLRRPQR